MNIMQQRFAAKPCIKGLQLSATSSCGVSDLRQTEFSEFIMDVAWSLKKPVMKSSTPFLTSVQIKRFTNLLNFLIENESTAILDRVVYYTRVLIDKNFVATNITDADMEHLWMNLDKARDILYQKLQRNEHQLNNSRKFLLGERSFNRTSLDHMSSVATSNSQVKAFSTAPKWLWVIYDHLGD